MSWAGARAKLLILLPPLAVLGMLQGGWTIALLLLSRRHDRELKKL